MPVVSHTLPKAARRFGLIAAASTLLLAVVYLIFAAPDAGQDACVAAHAAERGVSRQQLSSELRYQDDLVAILSVCSGMAP